jgi:putative nucleotidyltransferase with HDIG domain
MKHQIKKRNDPNQADHKMRRHLKRHNITKHFKMMKFIFPILMMLIMTAVTIGVLNTVLYGADVETLEVIGRNIFVGLFLLLLFVYMYIFKPHILFDKKHMLMLTIIYLIVIIPSQFLANTSFIWLLPYTLLGMIIALLIDEGLGVLANLVVTIIIVITGNLDISFMLFFIISGSISPVLTSMAKERQKMFYVALYMMAINGALLVFKSILGSSNGFEILTENMIYVLLNPALAVIVTYGSLPLFETIFNLLTPFKLLELTNTNHKLLQRLLLEAPGTYHHSQMVANLAEKAAMDIGANPLLARSGALFHDIGKMKHPFYFTENQNGNNPHDQLAPDSSAEIIINHVSDGVKLAKDHKLPKEIIDIIREHQGDAIVYYFYHKAKEHSDGFVIDPGKFKYNGPKPQSNEAAIVMIADCVEAAIKAQSPSDRTMEKITEVIREIIKIKILDYQLVESKLMLKELVIIEKAFIKVYNGMYHERIKYPEVIV